MAYLEKFYRNPLLEGTGVAVIGKNSEQFTKGDPVTIDANGFLIVATSSGEKILGFALEDKTCASDNQTVAKYAIQYVPALGVQMIYQADQDCVQTDIGAYADVTGTTGAIRMNLSAGATGQFIVLGFNPDGLGDSYVVVKVAEPQELAFAQS